MEQLYEELKRKLIAVELKPGERLFRNFATEGLGSNQDKEKYDKRGYTCTLSDRTGNTF